MRVLAFTVACAMLIVVLPLRAASGAEVVASIAPVHSLAARVMQGAGSPYLLLPPGASPHDHSLRPSDAVALEGATLVIWIGPRIEPWLEHPLETLAPDARVIRLADTAGLTRLASRKSAAFEAHDDSAVASHSDDETDPHLWLDPENAKLWLNAIATALVEANPQNSAVYLANAAAARAELDLLTTRIDAQLAAIRGQPFVVFHDAFQYFERRFGIEAVGAVAMSDARAPGPARIAEIRERIGTSGALCLFREPQYRSALVATVVEGTGVRIGLLDPLGANLAPGSDLYPNLLRGLAVSIVDCLR